MNKPQTIEGRWWIRGDDKPAHFGVLTYEPEKGLELSVKILQEVDPFSDISESAYGPAIPEVIHGTDKHGHYVTLFGSTCSGHSATTGLLSLTIHPLAAILNFQGTGWPQAAFQHVQVGYSLLHNWVKRNPIEPFIANSGRPAVAFKRYPGIIAEIAPGVRLRIEPNSSSNSSLHEQSYNFTHDAWFHFPEKVPVATILSEYVSVFLRLLCLFSGERVFKDRVSFFDSDPFVPGLNPFPKDYELLHSNPGVSEACRDRAAQEMRVSFEDIEKHFERIVVRWFRCHGELEPAIDLYFAVISNTGTSWPTVFLYLAQALEVYHGRSSKFTHTELSREQHKERLETVLNAAPFAQREWLQDKLASSNQKTLARRLDEILQLHPEEAAYLTAGIPDFAAKVRHTRNYYTHYSSELLEKGKVAQGEELFRLTRAMEALLEVCLLKELGIDGKPMARVFRRFREMRFTMLDQPVLKPSPAVLQASPSSLS